MSALIFSLNFDIPDLHYLEVVVKEKKIVTELNNRNSNSVKADVLYYARRNFISKSGGLPQALSHF